MNYTVISDKDNKERRNLVVNELNKIGGGTKIVFTDAVMATRMSDEVVYSYTMPNTYLTKGQVGCALSHKQVYEAFLDTKEPCITIFEDDIVFSDMCDISLLEDIMKIASEWEFPFVLVLQKSKYHVKEKAKVNDQVSIYSSYNQFCTHGYIINRAAAQNILNIQTPIRFEIDMFKFYYWLGAAELFCLNQDLVLQSQDMPSTIEMSDKDGKLIDAEQRKAYGVLYKELTFKQKCKVFIKRMKKVLHTPFETLDY